MNDTFVVLARAVMTFLTLFIFCRILGKSQISQMTFFEYVNGITIGAIAGNITTDLSTRPWPLMVGLLAWIGLVLANQFVQIKSRWLSKMMDGEPLVLIQNGQVLEGNLAKARISADELTSMLRAKGYFDCNAVEFAIFEPNGELSVLARSQQRPVTPADLGLPTRYEGVGIELIVDGQVVEQNLRGVRLNQAWLMARLREQGVERVRDVFLAVLDSTGELYVDRYADRVPRADDMSDYPGPN